MDKEKLFKVIHPDRLKYWISESFNKAGVTSIDVLSDDKKVKKAAIFAYKKIPLFPLRFIIWITRGKKQIIKLFFILRDQMLKIGSMEIDKLDAGDLKSWISELFKKAGINSVDALSDDKKVRKAAIFAYKKIPLLPWRFVIWISGGKIFIFKLIFLLRDQMLKVGSMDMAWLDVDTLKIWLSGKLQEFKSSGTITNLVDK